jgi:hypothetical protein
MLVLYLGVCKGCIDHAHRQHEDCKVHERLQGLLATPAYEVGLHVSHQSNHAQVTPVGVK